MIGNPLKSYLFLSNYFIIIIIIIIVIRVAEKV